MQLFLALLASAAADEELFNALTYDSSGQADVEFDFKFLTSATTDGCEVEWTSTSTADWSGTLIINAGSMPNSSAATHMYSLSGASDFVTLSQADLAAHSGWWYAVVVPEFEPAAAPGDNNDPQPAFTIEIHVTDTIANVLTCTLTAALGLLLVGARLSKLFCSKLYMKTYGMLTHSDDVVQEAPTKLDLDVLRERARERREREAAERRGSFGERLAIAALLVLLALATVGLHFLSLAWNVSLVYSSLESISSPLVSSLTDLTASMGFVGQWMDWLSTEVFAHLEVIDTLYSVYACDDVAILANLWVFVLMVAVLVAVIRADLLLLAGVRVMRYGRLSGSTGRAGRLRRVAWKGFARVTMLGLLYVGQVAVIVGAESGFNVMWSAATGKRTCNGFGAFVGSEWALTIILPVLGTGLFYTAFLFGGHPIEPNDRPWYSWHATGWAPTAPHARNALTRGAAHVLDGAMSLRFALARLVKATFGYWDELQIRSYEIEQRAIKFDDDPLDDDSRHEAVIQAIGRSTSLLFCAVPGCVLVAKFGEAANSAPLFVYDPDILLHTPLYKRRLLWAAYMLKWLVMIVVVIWPSSLGWLLLLLAAMPEGCVEVFSALADTGMVSCMTAEEAVSVQLV